MTLGSVRSGLCLPPDVIQPFLLRFRREDLHIMAFLEGHPDYEAVEAMVRWRAGGAASIRAILTRHDQRQIDHVNDDALLAEGHGVDRQTCFRTIALQVDRRAGRRHALLEFTSYAGEQIVLDLTAAGEPDPQRGGLSNPGNHSLTTSLPLMRRGASTLAGPQTEVKIDGTRFGVPVKVRAGPFVGHEGFFTERHLFAAIRAGAVTQVLRTRPDHFGVGAEWIFDADGKEITYRVEECSRDGQLQIARSDNPGETITASAIGERLVVSRISSVMDEGPGLELTFGESGCFGLSIDRELLVAGFVETEGDALATLISLCPAEPAWATNRQVRLVCRRDADRLTFATTIGAST